jgi:hypothetical protein
MQPGSVGVHCCNYVFKQSDRVQLGLYRGNALHSCRNARNYSDQRKSGQEPAAAVADWPLPRKGNAYRQMPSFARETAALLTR